MANHISHAGLPYPVKNARYTISAMYLDLTGTPANPTTPDSEISTDNGTFGDCTEEVTLASGSRGAGMLTLTATEMNCTSVKLWLGSADLPASPVDIKPRVLPILESGTAQAGGANSITLATGASDQNLRGCIVRTTGGTGGGSANNQARVIAAYDIATKAATVEPSWETNPDNTTTYDILITEMWSLAGASIDGKTPANALRIIAATCGGKLSGAGTGTEVFLGLDGTTVRVTATVDSSGNRTAVTY